jgi:hypothetical protein
VNPILADACRSGQIQGESLSFDYEVSWAGASSTEGVLCIGSEDGSVHFIDSRGSELNRFEAASPSGESINGVAFLPNWMSVSTRQETMLWKTISNQPTPIFVNLLKGSHGLLAGSTGCFLAALGLGGLLLFRPSTDPVLEVNTYVNEHEPFYHYALASLGGVGGIERIVSAGRGCGVAGIEISAGGAANMVSIHRLDSLDFIDVCTLNLPGHPHSAAAVATDGTLVLFRDVFTDTTPIVARYREITGLPHRLLHARGLLFVLTSEGLWVVARVVSRLHDDAKGEQNADVLRFPLDGIDANICDDRWLVIVLVDGILRIDLDLLPAWSDPFANYSEMMDQRPVLLHPSYLRESHEQRISSLAMSP